MAADAARQAIIERVERYFDSLRSGDLDARRRLFSPQGVLEEPLGTEPVEGGAALQAHWSRLTTAGVAFEPELKRVIVAGRHALALALVRLLPAQGPSSVTEVFAAFEFDKALEIRHLRVYRDESCTHLASTAASEADLASRGT